ncbi:HNH endonuclease [Rhodococcus rhodnii]|uniref:HNH endonuclease n=1 Tax=Rhodococcus rhodnii TaxID=38312 RepID=A0A6P2CJB1_9NOCA|nr:HNH endonuclease signature motif containing protein [Rhodococcus rhodnii]TXG91851.1 HNH endonuclease [Rhodococcus rhodnii]
MGAGETQTQAWQLGDAELSAAVLDISRHIQVLQARRVTLMGEVVERGLATAAGYRDGGSWLAAHTMLEIGEARDVAALGTGLRTEPEIAAAVAEQRISPRHASMLCAFFDKPPSAVKALAETDPDEHAAVIAACRAALLAAAAPGPETSTKSVRTAIETLRARLDVDTEGPTTREREDLNTLTVSNTLNGRVVLHGDLDALSGEILSTALSKLSAPRPADDGSRDRRSAGQRRADGLVEICRRHLDAGENGHEAAEKPHVTVIVHQRDLAKQPDGRDERTSVSVTALLDGIPLPWMPWGGTLSPETARAVACDARVTPVIVDDNGVPLSMGRTTRLVTPAQRRALTVRDRGCAFPNCTAPPAWCEAHHIEHWADGGPTDLDNTVLLCGKHHRHIHHSGWSIIPVPRGRPRFEPPDARPPSPRGSVVA